MNTITLQRFDTFVGLNSKISNMFRCDTGSVNGSIVFYLPQTKLESVQCTSFCRMMIDGGDANKAAVAAAATAAAVNIF